MKRFCLLFLMMALCGAQLFAQSWSFAAADVEKRISRDVTVLASDSLEGRESGTRGEYMARHYIAREFESIGLQPMFMNNSYFQRFTYRDQPWYGRNNSLVINGKSQKIYIDYYALRFTGCDSLSGETVHVGYGISAPEQGIDDYAGKENLQGKIFVIYTSLPDAFKKNSVVEQQSGKKDKVALAIKHGAKAVIFVRPPHESLEPDYRLYREDEYSSIPVIYVRNAALFEPGSSQQVQLAVNVLRDEERPAYNVAGYIDNGAENWIVIGGHYDHMGWSTGRDGQPEINNGADDNATGTAGVMELARFVKQSGLKNYNYVFCAFSGEEKGLIGSTYFTNSKVIENEKISCMLDLDMIGRLDAKRTLTVYGTGTSPSWRSLLAKANTMNMKIKPVKSGFGGSDHMPFYFKEIPDLFLHTGLHPDYHTPSDDVHLINFSGMAEVLLFAGELIKRVDAEPKLAFSKTTALQAIGALMK